MSVQKLNPQIREVYIGIKELHKIKVYPLSMADQLKMTSIIRTIMDDMSEVMNQEEKNSLDLADYITRTIADNLPSLLQFICPEDEFTLEDLTNFQFTEIVGHVYKDNFEDAGKNVKNLVEKMKTLFSSTRS